MILLFWQAVKQILHKSAAAEAAAKVLLLTEGLAVGALIHGGVHFVSTYQDTLQGAVVSILAVICALGDSALDALIRMAAHNDFLLFERFSNSMPRIAALSLEVFYWFEIYFHNILWYNSRKEGGASMEINKKILIDTDIGDDIDDTVALLSAMAHGFEIVGVTTVFRDTVARAAMVKKEMRAFGGGYEKVPVYAGYSAYTTDKEENTEHMCRFGKDLAVPELAPVNTDPEEAVDFILDCCHRYGKDLTVIAIGPFCNIAKAIEKDPEALNSAAQVVIMGGAYFKQYADWNVMCDVPAADMMFRSLRNLHCIGADVTHKLASDYLKPLLAKAEDGVLGYVGAQYRQWQQDYPQNSIVLHDSLTIYYVADPTVCDMVRIPVKVITEGFAKGFTLNVDAYGKASLNSAYQDFDREHKVLAAADVDLTKFHSFIRQDICTCSDTKLS